MTKYEGYKPVLCDNCGMPSMYIPRSERDAVQITEPICDKCMKKHEQDKKQERVDMVHHHVDNIKVEEEGCIGCGS